MIRLALILACLAAATAAAVRLGAGPDPGLAAGDWCVDCVVVEALPDGGATVQPPGWRSEPYVAPGEIDTLRRHGYAGVVRLRVSHAD